MNDILRNFYEALESPLTVRARAIIALLVIPLLLSFVLPLWRISMEAPQYPNGLSMDIYPQTVVGGHDGADISEINILNHYIGMRPIDRTQLTDLDWLPFAIGGLALLALRCAAIGKVRSLVDLFVLTTYFCAFAMGRFVYKLSAYGHDLNPDAPIKVQGFTPALFGTKQIANFTTHSWPQLGSVGIFCFFAGLAAIAIAQFWRRSRAEVVEVLAAEPATT
jgi:hypothetical protein